jgi:hypothetical protein
VLFVKRFSESGFGMVNVENPTHRKPCVLGFFYVFLIHLSSLFEVSREIFRILVIGFLDLLVFRLVLFRKKRNPYSLLYRRTITLLIGNYGTFYLKTGCLKKNMKKVLIFL